VQEKTERVSMWRGKDEKPSNPLEQIDGVIFLSVVGTIGFEPATPASQMLTTS
jgi:hypothetical protein